MYFYFCSYILFIFVYLVLFIILFIFYLRIDTCINECVHMYACQKWTPGTRAHQIGYTSWPASPTDPPVFASQGLGLQERTTTHSFLNMGSG